MPPKPWETTAANRDKIDTSEIASGTPFSGPSTQNSTNPLNQANNESAWGTNSNDTSAFNRGYSSYSNSSPYSSGYGGLGTSGYGSYGGGGYGSGYSSYGGGYGSYGGGYGGYGRGMYGGFGNRPGEPGQQGNFMEFALRYLDSFSYGVSSLCEMTRNIEMNAEGLSRFWASMKNILVRFFMWMTSLFKGSKELVVKGLHFIKKRLFTEAFLGGLLFNGKMSREKVINLLLRVCVISLALSLIAPYMKIKAAS